ncbi:MAG TPA: hypothetical protein VJ742_12445 [Nitrososphaera sp.]|nr:hypothetical protein [Nitrososphaera sp.]
MQGVLVAMTSTDVSIELAVEKACQPIDGRMNKPKEIFLKVW